jgi:DNA polymerase
MLDLADLPSCTKCALSEHRQRVVIGSGPERSSLMVLGEAPGRSEDEGGAPFIGRSGRLLFELIGDELGRRRDECFVTNVVKCRPPANRTPRPREIAMCRPWLDEQLRRCEPAVVLALGNTAAKSLFGFDEGISVTHGRVVQLGGAKGVATYHPAAALRGGPSVVEVMRGDLRIVRELLGAR